MIVRVAKKILRGILANTQTSQMGAAIAHFLNCFLGFSKRGRHTLHKKKKKKPQKKGQGPAFSLTHQSLWNSLRRGVQEHFQFELPEDICNCLCFVPLLRNLAQKMGIQIAAKNYNFSSENPFQTEDILDIFPVVKHTSPKVAFQKDY